MTVKALKTKEERVKEGIHLLKQLLDAGVKQHGSYLDLKVRIDEWIKTGEAWSGSVPFQEYGRKAEVILPAKNPANASIIFRVAQ